MSFLLHFTDTGFCTWLADIHTPQELMNDRRLCGHIPETWVFGQICRRFLNCGIEPRLCDLKGMKAIPLGNRTLGKGIVFCPITQPLPFGDGHLALPISALGSKNP